MILGEAVAGAGISARYKLGDRHAVLAFVQASDDDGAVEEFGIRCEANGWLEPVARKIGVPTSASKDAAVEEAEAAARETGFSMIVYEQPIAR